MAVIYIVCIVFILIVIAFTMHNLGKMEIGQKIILLIVGLVLCLILTIVLFKISSSKIEYYNDNIYGQVRNVIIALFTPLNGLAIMPFVARQIEQNTSKENDSKELKRNTKIKCIVFAIIILIVLILETKYMKNTQDGIMQIISRLVENK